MEHSIVDFWKSFKILDAVRNVSHPLKEVSERCMRSDGIRPSRVHETTTIEDPTMGVESTAQLGKETGWDKIGGEDIEEPPGELTHRTR